MIKVNAKYNDLIVDTNKGYGLLQLRIESYRQCAQLQKLSEDQLYSVEIKERKENRTLQQNKLFWKLVGEIDKAVNGDRSNDDISIYIYLLEKVGAKYEILYAKPETEGMLSGAFRVIKKIDRVEIDDQLLNVYKCFYGSSKFDTKEMNKLIEEALDLAESVGVDTSYYEAEFSC